MVDTDQIERLMYNYFEDAYLQRITPDDYAIDSDGAVHVKIDVCMVKSTPNRMLPVQFAVVDGNCMLSDRQLKSLKGAPHTVNGDFDCSYNLLTSLKHAPTNAIELLCNNNLLTNLTDAPACQLLWATRNPFQSFKHTPDHISEVVISYAPDLPLLGLLSVGKIMFEQDSDLIQLTEILNRHTQQGKAGQLKCAAELIRAGFKSNAYV
jgi:hypothetical protein